MAACMALPLRGYRTGMTNAGPPGADTVVGIETRAQGRVAIWSRRAFLVALSVFVALALLGLGGVRSATTTASGDGWDLSVRYPEIARAGLDVPFQVTVAHPGGFTHDIVLAVTADYFDIYETQGFHPEPSDETRDGDLLYLTFAAPPGDRLVVTYDTYVQPAAQLGRSATVSVVEHGRPVVSTSFATHLLP